MPVSVPDFTVVAAWHERVHRDPRAGVAATDDRDADCRLGSGEVAGGRGGAAAKGRVMRFVRHGASIALSLLAAGCTTPGPSSPDATLAQQQAHCRNLMYENRRIVGRGPPNWNMYDHCMREARSRAAAGEASRSP
jgi:hypothetical protein